MVPENWNILKIVFNKNSYIFIFSNVMKISNVAQNETIPL